MTYKGAPDNLTLKLGQLVIIAGRIESSTINVGEIYAINDAVRQSFSSLIKQLVRRARSWGTPEWARISAADVTDWAENAKVAMEHRNELFHSTHYSKFRAESGPIHITRHLRTGAESEAPEDDVQAVLTKFEALDAGASRIELGLMHQVFPGAYIRNNPSPSGAPDQIQDARDNLSLRRMTEADAIAYWKQWNAEPRAAWPPS